MSHVEHLSMARVLFKHGSNIIVQFLPKPRIPLQESYNQTTTFSQKNKCWPSTNKQKNEQATKYQCTYSTITIQEL